MRLYGRNTFKTYLKVHTISLFSIGEVRGDLHQTSLVDTHPHQSFVHPLDQLLLTNKHVVGAATVITETNTAQLNFSSCFDNSEKNSLGPNFHSWSFYMRLCDGCHTGRGSHSSKGTQE